MPPRRKKSRNLIKRKMLKKAPKTRRKLTPKQQKILKERAKLKKKQKAGLAKSKAAAKATVGRASPAIEPDERSVEAMGSRTGRRRGTRYRTG